MYFETAEDVVGTVAVVLFGTSVSGIVEIWLVEISLLVVNSVVVSSVVTDSLVKKVVVSSDVETVVIQILRPDNTNYHQISGW